MDFLEFNEINFWNSMGINLKKSKKSIPFNPKKILFNPNSTCLLKKI
jgi:hypothetical protein